MFPQYDNYDGLGLAELVRNKEVSPLELVEEAISRIEKHNPAINAVVLQMYEQAREKARSRLPQGPFTGVPFLIKDLGATLQGVPTSQGNKLLKNLPATVTTELVNRWLSSGVIVVGKTNSDSLLIRNLKLWESHGIRGIIPGQRVDPRAELRQQWPPEWCRWPPEEMGEAQSAFHLQRAEFSVLSRREGECQRGRLLAKRGMDSPSNM